MPRFLLTVATSLDGFIARAHDHAPQAWASGEEQELFFRDVEAADWAIMGRNTHEAADKPHRRRIIFSSKTSGWQRPTQLWLDPEKLSPADLAAEVSDVHPLENALILGGTRVHDWFLAHGAIDVVHLTIEPVTFDKGLDIFSTLATRDPVQTFLDAGFKVHSDQMLNSTGTRYLELALSK